MTKKKRAPVKSRATLSQGTAEFLDVLTSNPGAEAAPVEWTGFVEAVRAHEEMWVEVDRAGEALDNSPGQKNLEAFNLALAALDRSTKGMFGAYDKFMYVVAHANDAVLIPEQELQQIVKDSMSGNLDGVQFSVNIGMLAHKVAQVLRPVAIEDDELDPPLCSGCADG